ncbi:MAG: hypothetical protein AB7G28_05680 [Pirellulales bacterium]
MHATYPWLTPEQQSAIAANGGLPIRVEDPTTHKVYVLAEVPADLALSDEYVKAALTQGLASIEAGDLVAWDPERIKREGRQRLAERKAAE